jgi:NAD+ diphosphatase
MPFTPAVSPPAQTSATLWCLAFVEGQLLLSADEGQPPAPLVCSNGVAQTAWARAFGAAGEAPLAQHYLGQWGAQDCWTLRLPETPHGWRAVPLRAAMMALPAPLMALAGRAAQVLEWDRSHRFCGACGTPTVLATNERARRCPACGHTAYPRLSPAMMALVWRRVAGVPQLLLGRAPAFPPGLYSALAGFVEAGESLEDCVVREVAEETGVQVDSLRYYGSQSWPFPHSLMLAFTAQWVGGDIVPQPGEIEHAAWFGLDELPKIPPRFSISGHLIRDTAQALAEGRSP